MKRQLLVMGLLAATASGCNHPVSKTDFDALEKRVATLEAEHTKTRNKVHEILVWLNHQEPPNMGLTDWIDKVNAKLWPAPGGGGGSDAVRPPKPPDDF